MLLFVSKPESFLFLKKLFYTFPIILAFFTPFPLINKVWPSLTCNKSLMSHAGFCNFFTVENA